MKKSPKAAASKTAKQKTSKQSYKEKAAQQKAIVVAGVKTLEQYQGLMCNPRWWAIPHINDVELLKKIVETEKTPIINARAKARIVRLEKRAAKADGKTKQEKPKAAEPKKSKKAKASK